VLFVGSVKFKYSLTGLDDDEPGSAPSMSAHRSGMQSCIANEVLPFTAHKAMVSLYEAVQV
jgi:hypothetical protein